MAVGCSSNDDSSPSNSTGGTSAHTGGTAGTSSSAGGNATGGNTTGGSATGGSATGGSATGGSGAATSGGTAGSGGATAGSGGTAGRGGTSGSGGNAGTGGMVCPAEAGAGGEAGAGDSGLVPTADLDGDGVPNCLDHCPLDASRTAPGACGCGSIGSEDDTDSDGTPDCKDECPNDPLKIAAGVCGCGSSDTANADGDAVVDCKDACPKDPALTEAGACGCLPAALGTLCLAHRYKFDGSGTVAADSIGGTSGDATVVGAQLSGTGTVVLAGGATDQYVKLPANLISALGDNATFEVWVTWPGTGGDWQRVFDFGTSDAGAGLRGAAAGTIFLTPRAGGSGLRTAISPSNFTQEDVAGIDTPLPTNAITHVAVVLDGAGKKLSLYRDGVVQGGGATIRPETNLRLLNDLNNWLGRSQYAGDESLTGTIHDFRIYSRALTAGEISASFTAGPDAP